MAIMQIYIWGHAGPKKPSIDLQTRLDWNVRLLLHVYPEVYHKISFIMGWKCYVFEKYRSVQIPLLLFPSSFLLSSYY